jgi:hypothetical protein
MKFYACIARPCAMSFDCWHGSISSESGLVFYVLRYPSRQRESKCVLAQGALSL